DLGAKRRRDRRAVDRGQERLVRYGDCPVDERGAPEDLPLAYGGDAKEDDERERAIGAQERGRGADDRGGGRPSRVEEKCGPPNRGQEETGLQSEAREKERR